MNADNDNSSSRALVTFGWTMRSPAFGAKAFDVFNMVC